MFFNNKRLTRKLWKPKIVIYLPGKVHTTDENKSIVYNVRYSSAYTVGR